MNRFFRLLSQKFDAIGEGLKLSLPTIRSVRPEKAFFAVLLLGVFFTWQRAVAQSGAGAAGARVALPSSMDEPYKLPPDEFQKAKLLGRVFTGLHFGDELWQPVFLVILLASGVTGKLGRWAERRSRRWWLQTTIFAAMLAAGIFVVVEAPIGAVGHFFTLRYGISVEPWGAWLLDMAKSLALAVAIETPLLLLAAWLVRWSPRRFWVWFGVAFVPLMVLGTFLLPEIVEPMFNHFEPLAATHPELVKQLEKVVARTGTNIPPERMFLMQASAKSNGLNAYVTGIGASKRIVVWDTTADRMPVDEIVFTFAHETGHYALLHIPKGLALASVGGFFFFWIVAWLARRLQRQFGALWQMQSLTSPPGLVVLVLAISLVQVIAEPIENGISRHFEHEADVYGQEAIHGLVADPQKTAVASFQRLGEAYLDDQQPNAFVVWWTYDHPSIQSRARFAEHYDPWVEGRRSQFFKR
ncbi:M48 family metallopeptidase [Acidicapsa dinghuensis]|uniref:M48 family metallopeptidase n=1 Tax=Acidicapsa dinghuensis TaxID=2218256 RepID=A0ABW1EC95_9BACT|nr:M48 family metallopeptidase [Acidicapsa dinghuensis]